MNTNNQHTEYHYKSAFISKEDKGTLVKALWLILKTCFYPGIVYSRKELGGIYRTLGIYISSGADHYKVYVEICESIMLLAGPWCNARPGTAFIFLLGMLNWSTPKFRNNCPFLHSTLRKQRQKDPLLHIEWKYLADAVLACMEEPGSKDTAYWTKWLSDNHCEYELQVYLGVIRECTAKNKMS